MTVIDVQWPPASLPGLSTPEGIVDMVTRHWEWCADELARYPGTDVAFADEIYALVEPGFKVVRGAEVAHAVPHACARNAYRAGLDHPYATFRLARDLA